MTEPTRCTCEKPTWDEPEVGLCNYCEEVQRAERLSQSTAGEDGTDVVIDLDADGGHSIGKPDDLTAALAKITPIVVENGPDYATVHFGDGETHRSQTMTMNPQDWLDIQAAFERASQ